MTNPVAELAADHRLITPGAGTPVADVLVIGGGNAALCAAITAAEACAKVTLLERAPRAYRGGNSRHTRNFRCAHDATLGVLSGQYGQDEFYDCLLYTSPSPRDATLSRMPSSA